MKKYKVYLLGMALIFAWAVTGCSAKAPAPVEKFGGKGTYQAVQLSKKQAEGYVIPIGNANIVCAMTDVGMIGCGAFDVMALDSYKYPAAKMKSSTGGSIATIDDLLNGTVKEVNKEAEKLGVKIGMTGREALEHM